MGTTGSPAPVVGFEVTKTAPVVVVTYTVVVKNAMEGLMSKQMRSFLPASGAGAGADAGADVGPDDGVDAGAEVGTAVATLASKGRIETSSLNMLW